MEKYTYLLVNLCSVLVPFLFSFHPKLLFYKRWKYYLPATILTASFFISWDVLYTHLGVWSFNTRYILGFKIAGLPIEEILFFICIPYASIFSYHCFKILIKKDFFKAYQLTISSILVSILLIASFFYAPKLYTSVTFFLTAIFILLIRKKEWLSRFYFSYLILLIPFMIVNGILTGTGLEEPVVIYNSAEIINIRILTIPIEDTMYGLLLLGLNAYLYELFSSKYSLNNI